MLLNWMRTVAYKCPVCGSIEFNYISVFDFSGKKEYTIRCSCGSGFVKIITNSAKRYSVSMPCIACNEVHHYSIDFKSLWTKELNRFQCPKSEMELCFIGNDEIVRTSVDCYEMKMDILMNDIGYDDYFINNTVMLSTIDKIHDIAEKGNLVCQCGSSDVSLQMSCDRVQLICNKCYTGKTIFARTNLDLKQTLKIDGIVLCDEDYSSNLVKRSSKSSKVLVEKFDKIK